MAKILFGVCGVGYGHAVRSKILLDYLTKKNNVMVIAGLVAYDYLKANFKNVNRVDSLEFAFKDNKVLTLNTVLKNIGKISKKNYYSLKRLKTKIDHFAPEVIISDFEPFSIYYGKDRKLKILGFDNEHYLIEGKLDVPEKYKIEFLKNRFVVSFYKT